MTEQRVSPVPLELITLGPTDVLTIPLNVPENETDKQTESNLEISEDNKRKNSRKRQRNIAKWKRNIRKSKCQHGEEYINSKGRVKERKAVVKGSACLTAKCYFHCPKNISFEGQTVINKQFWSLDDNGKAHYYSKHVQREVAKRKRTENENSKKKFSYRYFLTYNNVQIRVCQEFFVQTLNVSKARIYYFFKKIRDHSTSVPRKGTRGTHKKKYTEDAKKEEVMKHIESFKTVESHYCRANTGKKYLERDLNLTRMYNMYVSQTENPVSLTIYRQIFNYDYNLAFFKPKKDLCDKCEAFKMLQNPNEKELRDNEEHIKRKNIGYEERQRDRARSEDNVSIITFDLQHVFSLPKANIGHYYYQSKLNVYNLTAHCSTNKNIYCAIWHEFISGRGGTHIASALVKILKKIVEDLPNLNKIILWSDSCVPQNRNKLLSCAIQTFLDSQESKELKVIEHKYSEPGHGTIQEIDAAHSCIERYIKNLDIWTPMNLIKILTHMPGSWKFHFKVLQMHENDYLDYQAATAKFNYKHIPFAKVKHIIYRRECFNKLQVKESFAEEEKQISILKKRGPKLCKLPQIELLNQTFGVSEEKKSCFKAMLPQMPQEAKEFFNFIIERDSKPKKNSKKNLE